MRAARRCTAPMKAPSPPPTMPRRTRLSAGSRLRPSIPMSASSLGADAEHLAVGLQIGATGGEIIESPLGHADDMIADEGSAFARTFLRMLDAAFPFHDRPALEAVLRELREDGAEIDLAVAQRTEAPRPVDPGLIAAIDAAAAVR